MNHDELLRALKDFAGENAARRQEMLDALAAEKSAALEKIGGLIGRGATIKELTDAFNALKAAPVPEAFIKAFEEEAK
jgi:hypothetical protein